MKEFKDRFDWYYFIYEYLKFYQKTLSENFNITLPGIIFYQKIF